MELIPINNNLLKENNFLGFMKSVLFFPQILF